MRKIEEDARASEQKALEELQVTLSGLREAHELVAKERAEKENIISRLKLETQKDCIEKDFAKVKKEKEEISSHVWNLTSKLKTLSAALGTAKADAAAARASEAEAKSSCTDAESKAKESGARCDKLATELGGGGIPQ